jgi:hypothetical protein
VIPVYVPLALDVTEVSLAWYTRALALRSEIRRAGWFIHENALPVNGLLSPLDNEQSPKDNVHQSSIRAASA